jgi:hypothetical protein
MSRASLRLLAAAALLGAWLVLLLSGVALGGAIHLVAVAALVVFPWGAARGAGDGAEIQREEEAR